MIDRRASGRGVPLCVLGLVLSSVACQQPNGAPAASAASADAGDAGASSASMAEFVQLMLPRSIEIQRYLTRPVSFAGSGATDGMEVILAALDSFGDPAKCVGNFQVELNERRYASGDKVGKRVALWSIPVDSEGALREYWDRLSRFFRFRLKLEGPALPTGEYVLTVTFVSPNGDKLHDEYVFQHQMASHPTPGP